MPKILDIGIDSEEINRFEKLKRYDSFVLNNFTKQEIDYCFSRSVPKVHLAGIFCSKEAVRKTIDDRNISFKDIEITHSKKGKPKINIGNYQKGKIKQKGNFLLSITHTKKNAIAFVLRQGK
jgi:phosphopantetheine--protein transferase-like protein